MRKVASIARPSVDLAALVRQVGDPRKLSFGDLLSRMVGADDRVCRVYLWALMSVRAVQIDLNTSSGVHLPSIHQPGHPLYHLKDTAWAFYAFEAQDLVRMSTEDLESLYDEAPDEAALVFVFAVKQLRRVF